MTCLHAQLPKTVLWSKEYVMFWKWNHITSHGSFINLPHYTLLSITDGEANHFGLCPKINRTFSTFINVWSGGKMPCQWSENVEIFNPNPRKNYWPQFRPEVYGDGHLATSVQVPAVKMLKHKELCLRKRGQELTNHSCSASDLACCEVLLSTGFHSTPKH